jgi:hypothetical protein
MPAEVNADEGGRPAMSRVRNDRIANTARAHHFDYTVAVPFICECSEERCEQLVRLTLAEYARAREACDHLTAPGHQIEGAKIARVKDGVWLFRIE